MNPTALTTGPAAPPRVRLEGTLDMVRARDAAFTLVLADGRELPGRLMRGGVAGLGRLLGRRLLVFGVARLGPAGEVESVDADGYIPTDGTWTRSASDPPFSPEVAAELARRWKEVLGKWPGDETDEEIDQALRELS